MPRKNPDDYGSDFLNSLLGDGAEDSGEGPKRRVTDAEVDDALLRLVQDGRGHEPRTAAVDVPTARKLKRAKALAEAGALHLAEERARGGFTKWKAYADEATAIAEGERQRGLRDARSERVSKMQRDIVEREGGAPSWMTGGLVPRKNPLDLASAAHIATLVGTGLMVEDRLSGRTRGTRKNPPVLVTPKNPDLAAGIRNADTCTLEFLLWAQALWGDGLLEYLGKKAEAGPYAGEPRFKVKVDDGRTGKAGKVLGALGFGPQPPSRSGRRVLFAKHYILHMGTALFDEPVNEIASVMAHEAVHIGIPNHGEAFRDICREHGIPTSERNLRSGKVIVQWKPAYKSRYVTIGEVDTAKEAEALAKAHKAAQRAEGVVECGSYRTLT